MPADNLQPLLDNLLLLITDSERFHAVQGIRGGQAEASSPAAGVLADFRSRVHGIRNRVMAASRRYVVAFVGAGNVGKSTLLNRVFGVDLAPRRNGPCTACPIEFHFGETYTVSVEYLQALRKPVFQCECSEDIHRCLIELADSDGAQSSESIRRVSVTAPLKVLQDNDLVIADTPGFGAAQIDGAEGSHESALRRYLETEVAQVFWVVLAEQGITRQEMQFRNSVFRARCQNVVVTGSEGYSAAEKNRFRKKFAPLFDSVPPSFHFVSGRTGLGVDELAKQIATLDGRLEAALDQIISLGKDLRRWVAEYRDNHPYLRLIFWNPASWANWNSKFHGHELTDILTLDDTSHAPIRHSNHDE